MTDDDNTAIDAIQIDEDVLSSFMVSDEELEAAATDIIMVSSIYRNPLDGSCDTRNCEDTAPPRPPDPEPEQEPEPRPPQ
jgi:hypothetical protein